MSMRRAWVGMQQTHKVRLVLYGTRTRYTRPIYKFREEITPELLEEKILEAWHEHEASLEDEEVDFPDGTTRIGTSSRLRRKSHAEQLPFGAGVDRGLAQPEDASEVWVVVYSTRESLLGTQVSPFGMYPWLNRGQAYKLYFNEGDVVLARDAPWPRPLR